MGKGNSLTVWSQDNDNSRYNLVIKNTEIDNAGIGSNYDEETGKGEDGGTVTINGGKIDVYGSGENQHGGAGIGGGYNGDGGTIAVNGGNITAAGGDLGAGIGGGANGARGNIAISGGAVTAKGGADVAGIGSGGHGANGGAIAISGGDVTADGYSNGAGIGGGNMCPGGTITISGGTVTAKAEGAGAGIGGGNEGDGGTITISGGTVTAKGLTWHGAGIGGGSKAPGGDITISGGKVHAENTCKGCDSAAGIGGGWRAGPTPTKITITGGQIRAISDGGYGIGSAKFSSSFTDDIPSDTADRSTITITGGHIDTDGVGGKDYIMKKDHHTIVLFDLTTIYVSYDGVDSDLWINSRKRWGGLITVAKPLLCIADEAAGRRHPKIETPKTGHENQDFDHDPDVLFELRTYVPAVYDVKTAQVEGGTVTADKTRVMGGDTVTVAVSPDGDYGLREPAAIVSPDTTVTGTGATCTFTMPYSDVTVKPNVISEWGLLAEALASAKGDSTVKASDYDLNGDKYIVAKDADGSLKVHRDCTLDLKGCTLDRGLAKKGPRADGCVLKTEKQIVFHIGDSVGGGKLTGGYNTDGGGGLVVTSKCQVNIDGVVTIVNNRTSEGNGGGVYVWSYGRLDLSDVKIVNNVAMKGDGGGVYVGYEASASLQRFEIHDNKAENGGGVYFAEEVNAKKFSDGKAYGNITTAGNGGGIFFAGRISFNESHNLSIGLAGQGNMAWGHGGGIYVAMGARNVTLDGSVTDNYTRGGDGGGVYVAGELTVNGNAYHAYVKAWKKEKGVKTYTGKASPRVHAITAGYDGKTTNARAVTVRTPKVKLAVGKTSAIRAGVKGVKSGRKVLAHEKALRYYSSDRSVAAVTSAGIIKATGVGSCTVYVMANNGVRASVKVTVPDYPSKISFKKSSYSVKQGKTLKLTNQLKLTPSGVTTEYMWYSAAPDIATVTGKGVVKGVNRGEAIIVVYTSNGKLAYTTVKVK